MALSSDEIPLQDPHLHPKARTLRKRSRLATFYRNWVQDWWLPELLSALVGIVVIVALCVVLKKYDGKETPGGTVVTGVNITLNTLVSILSTIGKAALLLPVSECISQSKWRWYHKGHRSLGDLDTFDKASRGP